MSSFVFFAAQAYTGGQFTQTSIGICRVNGINQPSFEGVCEYENQSPWGDACYGV